MKRIILSILIIAFFSTIPPLLNRANNKNVFDSIDLIDNEVDKLLLEEDFLLKKIENDSHINYRRMDSIIEKKEQSY